MTFFITPSTASSKKKKKNTIYIVGLILTSLIPQTTQKNKLKNPEHSLPVKPSRLVSKRPGDMSYGVAFRECLNVS